MKATSLRLTALSIVCAALAVSGCAGKTPTPLYVIEGAYPPGDPGCEIVFLPVGSKVVIPAGSTWKSADGNLARKHEKEETYTLKYQSMLFSQFYVENAMGYKAQEMKRE